MLRKILAVDDSALIHQMYKLFLSRYKNCKLVSAMNGLEALDKLGQEEGIDLILLDINMPVMNGEEMLRRLRANPETEQLPVIVVSTEGSETRLQALQELGASIVRKPFAPETLRETILRMTGVTDVEYYGSVPVASDDSDF